MQAPDAELARRLGFEETEDGFRVVFPGYCNWWQRILLILSMLLGLAGAILFLTPVFRADLIFKTGDLFKWGWLFVWAIFIVVTFRQLLWHFFNREILTVTKEKWILDKQGTLLRNVRELTGEMIKNIRIKSEKPSGIQFVFSRQNDLNWHTPEPGSTICFDAGYDTIRMGSGLQEAEALALLIWMEENGFISASQKLENNAAAKGFFESKV